MDNLPLECGDTVSPLVFLPSLLGLFYTSCFTPLLLIFSTFYSSIPSFFGGHSRFFSLCRVADAPCPTLSEVSAIPYRISNASPIYRVFPSVFTLFASIYPGTPCDVTGSFF